jgi:hypothetical protein
VSRDGEPAAQADGAVGGGLVAVVEVYLLHPHAFTSTEVDRARVVAQQFGPVPARLATTRASR